MNVPYCENCFFYEKSISNKRWRQLSRTSRVVIWFFLFLCSIIATIGCGITKADFTVWMLLPPLGIIVFATLWLNLIIKR